MLGTLRFILASMVAMSHIGWLPLGVNPGISAVVVFYMISGYVVTGLWFRLTREKSPLKTFYIDRWLRIYPAYFFVVLLGFAVWIAVKPDTYYLAAEPGLGNFLENVTVIPLNYFMFNESDRFVFAPPAWSLGAELQFYLLLPVLLRFPKTVFAISFSVAALAQSGVLPREWFTYRLLPGVLHIFMAGALLGGARSRRQFVTRATVIWGVYMSSLVILTLSGQLVSHREPHLYPLGMLNVAPEVLMGLLVGLPLVAFLAPRSGHILDSRLGDFSYGVFLNHFVVFWCIAAWSGGAGQINPALFIGLSTLIAMVGWYLVETQCKKLRYSLRKRRPAREVLMSKA